MSTHTSNSSKPLAGRVAVVTGASSGIGAATAALLAARGAKVALLARRQNNLTELASAIEKAGGTALSLPLDVTSQQSVDEAAGQIAEKLGTVSIVLNNAGVMLPAPVTEKRTADWEQMINLNVMGAMRVIGAFTPALIDAAKAGSASDLVNISSVGAQAVFPNFAVYCATKAAISHLSRNLRTELGPQNVRVSMIEPGLTATELQSHVKDEASTNWIEGSRTAIDWLQGDDIADMIAYLVGLPKHVNLQQITIVPTKMA